MAKKDVTILLYTESEMRVQILKTPNVKNPEKGWLDMPPGYLTSGELDEVEESLEGIFKDINAGKVFAKRYPWEYSTPSLIGQYLVVMDRNKSIVLQLQKDITGAVQNLCEEFGFKITVNDWNVPGFYLKISIQKK